MVIPELARQLVERWSARQVHDTVAAIARQPIFNERGRSLLGRVSSYLLDRLADLLRQIHGSPGARAAIIAGLALIVVVLVARIVIGRGADARARAPGRPGAGGGAADDPWSVAATLAAAGDHTAACHALHAAVVVALGRAGLVRPHSSKTSGDYVRELHRRGAPAAHQLRDFAREFDRVIYGVWRASPADFERLADAAHGVVDAIQRPRAA